MHRAVDRLSIKLGNSGFSCFAFLLDSTLEVADLLDRERDTSERQRHASLAPWPGILLRREIE
jgi:hypothetical protein